VEIKESAAGKGNGESEGNGSADGMEKHSMQCKIQKDSGEES